MRNRLGKWGGMAGVCLAALYGNEAQCGVTVFEEGEKIVSIGGGFRGFLLYEDEGSPGGDSSFDPDYDSVRLYFNAQLYEWLKFEFNTELDSDEDLHVLDAVAKIEPMDEFNVWAGRFLPPSDRSNLDGPYYLSTWYFPFAQAYPAKFAGRDDGVAVWGQFAEGLYKYQVGVFQGKEDLTNPDDNLLFAGRVVVNFLDPEPGYYNSSTYYGEKDILALGFSIQSQDEGAGTPGASGDFLGWNFDFLFEKNLEDYGVFTLEGAYYDYDLDDVADPSLVQGSSYFVMLSYLLPYEFLAGGRFQPQVRWMEFDRDFVGDRTAWDVGINYIINGHDTRLSLVYRNEEDGLVDSDSVLLGLQMQF